MPSNRNPAGEGAVDLTTRYMGLYLKNPLIASASPLTGEIGAIRHIEDCGAAAVVLPSIFEEQIEQEVQEYEHLTGIALDGSQKWQASFPGQASTNSVRMNISILSVAPSMLSKFRLLRV
jgi:dihydroorotate dehydrogenase (fumarate)